jgi:voltage-gated potassium channel Kch
MDEFSLGERLRYAFDNTMSRGTIALIGWLALISAAVIFTISLIVTVVGISPGVSFVEQAWSYLMLTLEPDAPDNNTWAFRLSTLIVVLSGIFVISTLIGVLTTGIDKKIEELRQGRSKVIEKGHTVILGWSEHIFSIIPELVIANENQPKSQIVILGDKDKMEMESEIEDKVGKTGRTRIICRRGSPIEMADLEIVSLRTAKSIIVLAPEEEEDPDSSVIKTLLAIVNNPYRRPEPYHIVTHIHDPKNAEVARLVGGNEVEVILTANLIARITAQTCRQSGLSVVYTELLDFGGDEIYFQHEPTLVGKTFGEAILAYEDSTVIGLALEGKTPLLNPPVDALIQPTDEIIAISEDDNTVRVSESSKIEINREAIQSARPTEAAPENILILGWNWHVPYIINELDHYVVPGSKIMVVAASANGKTEIARHCANLKNLTVTFEEGDTTDRRTLEGLGLEVYSHIVLVAYSDTLDTQHADARTLITLLHIRNFSKKIGHSFAIVSEMLDIRNQNLVTVTKADDFVISDRLVSLMLSQISEHKALHAVFADLFDPEGSEIYLKSAGDYVKLGQPVTFYTAAESARLRDETIIGYRLRTHIDELDKNYGVVVNPVKSALVTFSEQDQIIVLAEKVVYKQN